MVKFKNEELPKLGTQGGSVLLSNKLPIYFDLSFTRLDAF
jgi:hypothetical protein